MRRVLLLLMMLAAGACTSAPPPPAPPSAPRLADCSKLFGMWYRYEQHATFHHTGQRARTELALDACQHGRYDEGIAELKRLLRRGGFTIPD
jgi:hypothetical protein